MNCLVCGHKDLGEFVTQCPNCEVDLVQLTMLNEIEEEYVAIVKERIAADGNLTMLEYKYKHDLRRQRKKYARIIFLLLLLPLLAWFFGKKQYPPLLSKSQPCAVDSINTYYQSHIANMQKDIEQLQTTKVRQIKYVMKEGQVLEDLGVLFFNNRNAGYQIMKDNNINKSGQYTVRSGDTILINFR